MLGTYHSWAITMRNILTHFQNWDHKLYLKTVNGKECIPQSLLARLDRDIAIPDLDICYTLPSNFPKRFKKKAKLKVGLYNYESDLLPKMWKDSHRHVDYIIPSSQFSKDIFLAAGWPEEKCVVVPLGIDPITKERWESVEPYKLKTEKKFKFLNVSIPHYRKNIDLLVDAYYRTFSGKDDVCLILKTSMQKPKNKFEIDVGASIKELQKIHANRPDGLPHIEVIQNYIPDMLSLYKSCDVLVNAASSEGFGLPMLEALDAGRVVIAPRCSGHLDFLNDNNSLLVDVKEIEAGPKYQYWIETPGAKTNLPKIDFLCQALLIAYRNYPVLQEKFAPEARRVSQQFTWENTARKILELK